MSHEHEWTPRYAWDDDAYRTVRGDALAVCEHCGALLVTGGIVIAAPPRRNAGDYRESVAERLAILHEDPDAKEGTVREMAHTLEIPDKIADYREYIAERLASLDEDTLAALKDVVAIDDDKRFRWQNLKSLAHVDGRIDGDTHNYLWAAIGKTDSSNNGGWPEGIDLVDQVVVTRLMTWITEGRKIF
jgi:hypothetical protein